MDYKAILKRSAYSISFFIISYFYVFTNRYTGREKEVVTHLDNLIPFNKYFVLVYVFWYAYVGISIAYFCIYDEKVYYKLLIALNTGMVISYIIFFIYPTTVARPDYIPGNDLIGMLFKFIYKNDNPYNCLPSIHVLNTITVAFYIMRDELYMRRWIKTAYLVCAAAIIYSTLAIKQHVILDALTSAVLACILYAVLNYKEVFVWLRATSRLSET